MRVISRLLVLSAVLILLSGSLVGAHQSAVITSPEEQTQINLESLLTKQEEDLEDYRLQLQKAGEETYAERQGELRREQAQNLHNEARALQAHVKGQLQELQDELQGELLRQQLQLMLVTLDEKQQQARLDHIAELQNQMQVAQESLEEEYQDQLEQLQATHEERSLTELAALKTEVERAMDDEFAQYRLGLLQELEEEIAKMRPKLASEYTNR